MHSQDTCAYPAVAVNTGATSGTALATPSADNTFPSTYTVLSASLPDQADGFILDINTAYGSGLTSSLIEIYVGASGQEQVLVSGIRTGRASSTGGAQKHVYVPISIPAGSRVTARQQCSSAAGAPTVNVSFIPLGAGFSAEPSATISETWGANSAASKGTVLTASATANAIGSIAQLIAATGFECRHLILQAHPAVAGSFQLTLYIGAAGSEVPLFGPMQFSCPTDSSGSAELSIVHGATISFPLSVPAGSRISAAIQSSVGSATADVCVLAFD